MTRREQIAAAIGTAAVCVLIAVFLYKYWWV